MTAPVSERARRPRRARVRRFSFARRFVFAVSSSWLLERMIRTIIIFVIVFGLLLTGLGLTSAVGTFSTDLSRLVQFAGSGDAIVSSTLDVFRTQVLVALGLAKAAPREDEISMLPQTGAIYATPTAFAPQPATETGFLPMQVAVDALQQEAPPLPTGAQLPSEAPLPTEAASAGPTGQPGADTSGPAPTATPEPPAVPGWMVIPRIGLDAPIIVSHTKMIEVSGKAFAQWEAPNLYAAGWQEQSALLGEPGNTVLNGHHNVYGEVFGRLHELEQYDEIILYSGTREFHYLVSQVMKLEERDVSLEQRQENARWIMHSNDERLTLVTCWPPTSNTYRLIVVAVPVK